MKRERWAEVERLYYAALEREPAARADFLEEASAGDAELRREVARITTLIRQREIASR